MDQMDQMNEATRTRRTGDGFREVRPLLFSIAYRMLGSVVEAEDVVQDAYLRWHRAVAAGTEIESPKAYLASAVTRLSIDRLRRARSRRETYMGPWLPEPLVGGEEKDMAAHAEMADSLSMAFLVLLEQLNPVERAVFLLREVFEHGYDEIAEAVGKSQSNCRQIFVRARGRIEAGRPRFDASKEQRGALADRFFAACQDGDLQGLVDLLTEDVVFVGDGGGRAQALPEPLHGRERIARFLVGLFARARTLRASVRPAVVNGQPGAVAIDVDGRIVTVMTVDVADGRVEAIRSVVNPDKLGHLGPVSDVARTDGPR
jgi:RNA polymerase sigma-70 factor (ECF subfamily)